MTASLAMLARRVALAGELRLADVLAKGTGEAWLAGYWGRIVDVLAGGEEAGIGAAGADAEPHQFATFWAAAFVRSLVSIHVHARVNIAADKVDADEFAGGGGGRFRVVRTGALAR